MFYVVGRLTVWWVVWEGWTEWLDYSDFSDEVGATWMTSLDMDKRDDEWIPRVDTV